MTYSGCGCQTTPSSSCQFCDAHMSSLASGTKTGVARRLGARLLDEMADRVFVLEVLLPTGMAGAATNSDGFPFTTFFWALAGYVFALWFLAQGTTPGKWQVSIHVIDKRTASNPGLGRRLVRELGYFWAICDRDNQAWHDKLAGTAVARESAVPDVAAGAGSCSWA